MLIFQRLKLTKISLPSIRNILANKSKYIILNKFNMISTEDNKRATQSTGQSIQTTGNNKIGGDFIRTPKPQFLETRNKTWEVLYSKQEEYYKSLPREKITITLKNGNTVEGTSFETTPKEIGKSKLPQKVFNELIVAKV
jgi:hypothetical protein